MLKRDGEWDDRVDIFDLGSTLLAEEATYGYYIDKCVKKLESLDIEVSSDSYKRKWWSMLISRWIPFVRPGNILHRPSHVLCGQMRV